MFEGDAVAIYVIGHPVLLAFWIQGASCIGTLSVRCQFSVQSVRGVPARDSDPVRESGPQVSAAWRWADWTLSRDSGPSVGFAPWVAVVDGASCTVSSRRSHIIKAFTDKGGSEPPEPQGPELAR